MDADLTFIVLFALGIIFEILYIRFRIIEEKLLSAVFAMITALVWWISVPVYLGSSPSFYGAVYIFVSLGVWNVILALESFILGVYDTITRAQRRGSLF